MVWFTTPRPIASAALSHFKLTTNRCKESIKVNSEVKLFQNPEFGNVRVVMRGGEPWFVARDVCAILEIANSRDALSSLEEDEKITVANPDGNPRAGIPHEFNVVSESGLYALVFKSRKPEAKRFRKWVTSEVLPSIRKTGGYGKIPASYVGSTEDLVGALTKFLALHYADKNQLMLAVNKGVKNATGLDLLALSGTELIAPTQTHLLTPTQLGKQLSPPLSAQKVNLLLAYNEFQNNVNGSWIPTDKGRVAGAIFMDTGKRHNSGTPVRQLKWPRTILAELKI